DRLREYGPRRRYPVREPGLARPYARFLVEELKPFVDCSFRTLPGPEDTAVGGSSMGGLISLYLCRWYPGVFGLCGAMSPSLWWDKEAFLAGMAGRTGWVRRVRIWPDMGGREGKTDAAHEQNVPRARALAARLDELGADLRHGELPD